MNSASRLAERGERNLGLFCTCEGVCERHLLNDSTATDCHRLPLDGRLFSARASLLFEKIARKNALNRNASGLNPHLLCRRPSLTDDWYFTINTWPTSSTPTFNVKVHHSNCNFIEKHIRLVSISFHCSTTGGRRDFLFLLSVVPP
jgi:hypothetical protein